jgi:hypothetical protein
MKKAILIAAILALAVITAGTGTALAAQPETGNGAPSGPHYSLNILGKAKQMPGDYSDTSRHTIMTWLNGNSRINLCDSAVCADGGYEVLDGNATDGPALLALPTPDPDPTDDVTGCPAGATCTTTYSVWIRQLGTPTGSGTLTSCVDTEITECKTGNTVTLTTRNGQSKFSDVSKQLLTVCLDTDDTDGTDDCDIRQYLFADSAANYYWSYDNNGLRLVQLRFYPISSTFTA